MEPQCFVTISRAHDLNLIEGYVQSQAAMINAGLWSTETVILVQVVGEYSVTKVKIITNIKSKFYLPKI